MKLSIIIVNYNVKYFLEQCLYSVRRALIDIDAEVIVVDNNSVDGSMEMVAKKFPEVIAITNKENVGFSKANNQGIKISTGKYVLLLNPDTVVQEDTFSKTIAFMDSHPDAGGLGVMMIDGKGEFLSESKRGLPTPAVAFYKVSGLSALFKKSKIFGRYHLGFLDKNKIHEVDILAGAFMLMRKETLDKCGLLDETFFMYGEDIDLSYRIQQAGYKNYYFPDTRIIHYKGESTKKSSVNYVLVFYNAMIIFAKKHFSQKNARIFSILINLAIYLRAGMAITSRFASRIFLPVFDALVLYGGMYILKTYWENNHKYVKGDYAPELMQVAVPAYIFCWLLGVFLSGGYDKPVKLTRIIRGLFFGTLIIISVYAFLNEGWRFSRALIILGAFWAVISMLFTRMLMHFIMHRNFRIEQSAQDKKIVLVANVSEGKRVMEMINRLPVKLNYIGLVNPEKNSRADEHFLGNISQLSEIVQIYDINEVIFSTKDIALHDIMSAMATIQHPGIDYKIAPEESLFIIGSNSVDNPGDLYTIDIKMALAREDVRRNKRIIDIIASIVILGTFPLSVLVVKDRMGLINNCFRVLFGKKTWVGYINHGVKQTDLPVLTDSVLSPADGLTGKQLDASTAARLNMIYARNYRIENDLLLLWKGLKNLGRK